jgi:hypothetical protein
MNRQEHLEWCKKRALEYSDNGDYTNAYASMVSDLNKHEELKNHAGIQLGMMLLMSNHLSTKVEIERFINGFN